MMIFVGFIFLVAHFYVCKVSTDWLFYFATLNVKYVKNSFLQSLIYIILMVISGATYIFLLFIPIYAEYKFSFFLLDDTNLLLLWYSTPALALSVWFAQKKHSKKGNTL